MMPQMDGLEVLARLKGNPSTASIPVICLTAKMHHEDVQKGYKLGAEYYITKPFTSTQLMTSINRLLGVPERRTAKRLAQVFTSNLAGQNWLKRGAIKDSISIS
jgi:CheY-like chemotaxis protein